MTAKKHGWTLLIGKSASITKAMAKAETTTSSVSVRVKWVNHEGATDVHQMQADSRKKGQSQIHPHHERTMQLFSERGS